MLAFVETILGLGMLVALAFLAFRRRWALVILGAGIAAGSFPVFRWMRDTYGSGSWQIWVCRVVGLLIDGLFIWLAVGAYRNKSATFAQVPPP